MKAIIIIARILLGLVFVVFGSNGFLQFMAMPPMSGPAGAFMGAMHETGYLSVINGLQVVGGLLLLFGPVPLGLTLLGPVIVNILCFHIFMDQKGLPLALGVSAVAIFLLCVYRANFAGLVKPGCPTPKTVAAPIPKPAAPMTNSVEPAAKPAM